MPSNDTDSHPAKGITWAPDPFANPGEAGPSAPLRHRQSISEPVPLEEGEEARIHAHIISRRKSSIVPAKLKQAAARRQSLAQERQAGEGEDPGQVDGDPDPAGTREDAAAEQQQEDEEFFDQTTTFDVEALKKQMPDMIRLLKQHGERDWQEPSEEEMNKKLERGFAWDVMFENQRGIHFLGKGYFSSATLLPIDPSEFTLPSHPLPTATTLTISEPVPASSSPQSSGKSQRKEKKTKTQRPSTQRNIRTGYTLADYQCPGPQWSWVTPWMINMKVGTDEGGWRYNAWFRPKGWRNHAGPAGWWGWVRRREWVRLRMVGGFERPEGEEDVREEKDDGDFVDAAEDRVGPGNGQGNNLEGVLRGDQDVTGQAEAIARILARTALDRRKLEWWMSELEKLKDDPRLQHGLQDILDDPIALNVLNHSFTYRSSVTAFADLLHSHDFHSTPNTPSDPTAEHSTSGSTPATPTSTT